MRFRYQWYATEQPNNPPAPLAPSTFTSHNTRTALEKLNELNLANVNSAIRQSRALRGIYILLGPAESQAEE